MKKGPLSKTDKAEITRLYQEEGVTTQDIAKKLKISKKRVEKFLFPNGAGTETEETVQVEEQATEESAWTDADWSNYWKQKYLDAHVVLVINGLA